MNIRLDEKYSINTDKYNWIVVEHYEGKDKDGLPVTNSRNKYFPRLDQCLNWLIQNECKESVSLAEIKKKLELAESTAYALLGIIERQA